MLPGAPHEGDGDLDAGRILGARCVGDFGAQMRAWLAHALAIFAPHAGPFRAAKQNVALKMHHAAAF